MFGPIERARAITRGRAGRFQRHCDSTTPRSDSKRRRLSTTPRATARASATCAAISRWCCSSAAGFVMRRWPSSAAPGSSTGSRILIVACSVHALRGARRSYSPRAPTAAELLHPGPRARTRIQAARPGSQRAARPGNLYETAETCCRQGVLRRGVEDHARRRGRDGVTCGRSPRRG